MKITVAKTAGFCFGVKNAVEAVHETIKNTDKQVYTYGPIIHNETVINELKEKGVRIVKSEEEIDTLSDCVVIIRSHGVSKAVWEKLHQRKLHCVDATCPFVKKIHRIVNEESRKGKTIIIAGNPEHPEVQGIKGWAEGPCFVVENAEDFAKLPTEMNSPVLMVAQTTFNSQKFQEFVEILEKMNYYSEVKNTVCSATRERQTEAMNLSLMVDAMIVIGDKHSSNTLKLYEICNRKCKRTYFIEKLFDLEPQPFQTCQHVGITAGASTPKNIIEEVQSYLCQM